MKSFTIALTVVLALTSAARGQETDEHAHEEATETCEAALNRLVAFMEEEAGHDHAEDHRVLQEAEEEHALVLEALTCSNTTFSVEFEGEVYENIHLDEYQWDGCAASPVETHCEMLACEDGDLHLVRYHGCCADVTAATEIEEECFVEVEEAEASEPVINAAVWGKTIGAALLSALASLIGVVVVFAKSHKLDRNLLNDVTATAIGLLLSTVFVHLIPEASETIPVDWPFGVAFLGGIFSALFIQMGSSMLGFGHAHAPTDLERSDDNEDGMAKAKVDIEGEHVHEGIDYPLIYNIVIGDGIHNLVDGMIIAIAFAACPDSNIGWIALGAILAHELPQEMIDFLVLVRAGLSFKSALIFNFLSQCTCILGAIIVLALNASISEAAQAYLLVYGSGFLAYVALAELTPSIATIDSNGRKAFRMFLIVAGAVLIGLLGLLHTHCETGDSHDGHSH